MRAALFLLVLSFALSGAAAGARAAHVEIVVTAATDELAGEMRAVSLTAEVAARPESRPQDLLAAARADYARLIAALYGRGFYSPVIRIRVDGREAAGIAPYAAPAKIGRIELQVDPGPRFAFGRAVVTPLAPGTELPGGFATGEPAFSTVIGDAAGAAVEGWRDIGHAKARVAGQAVTADHRAARLDAEIRLAPGPRLRFGELILDGSNRTRPERIRAIAGLPEGEVFSPGELQRAADRLRRSGAFRSVSLRESDRPDPDGTLDIEAALVDEKKRRLGFGAELSSFEGLGVSAFWMHRNLMRGAERLRLEGEADGIAGNSGGIDFRFAAGLTRPATISPDTSLTLLGEAELLDEPDFFERKLGAEIGLQHAYTDNLSVSGALGLRYTDVNDDLGARDFTHLTLPLAVTWDRRDDRLDPASGFFLEATGEPFVALGAGAPGARVTGDARLYRGFGARDRVVMAGRLQLGAVLGSEFTEVPPDMLFFSGGGGTVRGQPYQALGVDLAGGGSVGGRSFLGISAEIRVGLNERISVVGFADSGFVGAEAWPGSNGAWHSGAGLGLRYDTGIGPIRLDVAAPTGGATADGVQFYIGVGQAF